MDKEKELDNVIKKAADDYVRHESEEIEKEIEKARKEFPTKSSKDFFADLEKYEKAKNKGVCYGEDD